MAETVYILCTVTSLLCAVLLFRGYGRTGLKLLFWSALCFAGFALSNVLLFVDMVVVPGQNLAIARIVPALFGLCALVYGLVKEAT